MAMASAGTEMSAQDITAHIDAERKHIIEWATSVIEFVMQEREDKIDLLSSAWDSLVIFSMAHHSKEETEKLLLASGEQMQNGSLLAEKVGITGTNYTNMLSQLLPKLREINFDQIEWRLTMGLLTFYRRLDEDYIKWGFDSIKGDMDKYWKKQRSSDSSDWAKTLFDIKMQVDHIAGRCRSMDHLLFPDNQEIKTFLMKKLPQAPDRPAKKSKRK